MALYLISGYLWYIHKIEIVDENILSDLYIARVIE